MAYSNNILPKSAAYYTLSNASISGTELSLSAGGFAEIQVSAQMLPKLTAKMLVVAHPSVFSDGYTNDCVQVTLSILTSSGSCIEYLIPVCYDKSGVFNTEIELPEEEYALFTYRISSNIPVVLYNWELCAEEAVDVTTVIDGVEQSLPKLLYDYNTYSYVIAQQELTVGLISCFLQDATDLQGHFTISFFATERCNVHIRIKDNGITELYTPVVYTVEKGYSSVSVPHAYLKKLATDHVFSVTMQCSNGQLSIPVRGMLYTIDGGYLATRLLDAGTDLEDISIKQLSTDLNPSEIWAIGYEGTRLILKKRSYSQLQRENWEAVKDFGEGIEAGVEFPGRWIHRAGADKFTLETESTPYVFVVDLQGNLKAYYGSTFSTEYLLDIEVSNMSSCQGFNSMYDIVQDQGLVVAYVKNGNAYYTQWTYDSNTSAYTWYTPSALYEAGDALFVSVHRLPDYRLGICVEHSAGTKWYITDRTYVSQGIKPEVVDVTTGAFVLSSVFDADRVQNTVEWVATQNTFETASTYNNFVMTFEGPLTFLLNKDIRVLRENIAVSFNGVVQSDAVESVFIDSNVITVVLKEDVKAGRTVLISYNCPYLVMKAYNGCLAIIKQEYSWTLATPTVYLTQNDNVDVGVNALLNAVVRPIVTTPLNAKESPNVSVDASLDATVYAIITHSTVNEEDIDVSVSSQLNVAVLQTGTSPI